MHQVPGRAEDHRANDEPSQGSSPEQEHNQEPSNTHKETYKTDGQFRSFWKRHWQQWKNVSVHDKLNTFFTIVIAVATVAYVIVTKHQLNEMRSSGTHATEQTRKLIEQATVQATNTHDLAIAAGEQADNARKAAGEATKSREQSERAFERTVDQFHLEQRAWLGIKGIHVDTPEADKEIVVLINFINSGKTIAANVGGYCLLAVGDKPKITKFPEAPRNNEDSSGVTWPNGEFTASASGAVTDKGFQTFSLTKPGIVQLQNKQIFLFVYGVYTYTDVFKSKHTTAFCGRYSPTSKLFESCSNHNYAN